MRPKTTWPDLPTDIHLKIIGCLAPVDAARVMATCTDMRDLGRKADTWERVGGTDYNNFTMMMKCISAVAVPSLQRSMQAVLRQPAAPWLSAAVHEALCAGDVTGGPFRDADYELTSFNACLTDMGALLELDYVHKVEGRLGRVGIWTDLANRRSEIDSSFRTNSPAPEGISPSLGWTLYVEESSERCFGPALQWGQLKAGETQRTSTNSIPGTFRSQFLPR